MGRREQRPSRLSTGRNKLLVRQFYEEVVNTGDISRVAEFVAPDLIEIHDGVAYESGIEGMQAHIEGGRRTYSGLHLTVDRQVAEGDWVVTQVTACGVHTGEWMGIEPTGKSVVFTCVNVDRVVDSRIVEHGGAANMLGPLMEIGAVKAVGPSDG